FAGLGDGTWGTAEQRSVLEGQIEQVAAWSAQNNVPVMVSEFGAIHDTDFNSRMRYYSVYVSSLIENEMPHQVWDDGGMFEVLKRDVLTWHETKEILLHTWPDGPDWFDISTPGDSLIVLSWQNRALHDHIEVQRKTGEEAFSTVAVLPATATSWSDTTGQKGTTYDYRIIARNAIEGDRHSHPLRAHLRAIPLSEFYHTEGTRIVPAEGAPEMARGIGLGGWLVPEGYMLHTPGHWGPTQISNAIEALIGAEDTQTFWEMYRSHYVAEADVELIARWGFDHIRVPMHWKLLYDMDADIFIESGFDLLDNFLDWCGKNGIYVVLDLHAAPGAQSDGPIADSDGTARLWTEPVPYQDATVKLWQEIARRYVFDTRIIGYDLLNEPVTPDEIEEPAVVLRALYKRITKAIREVDKNHILFIEGNYFATTFDNLAPPFDDNMVYSFHKYWNSPDLGTIGYLLNLRESTNVPLWLGETGENSNTWFHETVKLMEDNDIGWNIWTHKKLRTTTSPLSTPMSEGYASILDYWKDEGAEPTREEAREALFEQARLLHVDSARTNPGVIPSLLDPDFGLFRVPFTQHDIPGFVNAADYDIGKTFVTHSDKDYWAINGSPGGGNSGGHYRNDGVDIEPSTDSLGHAYNVGWLEPLEWMEYTVDVQESGLYTMTVRVSAINAGGAMTFYMDGARIGTISVPQTGGWQAWHSVQVEGIQLEAGRQVLRATVGRTGGFNVNRFTFDLVSTTKTDSTRPSSEPSFDLYPIPAKGIVSFAIRVPLHSQVKIRLYDLLGRLVGEKTADVGVGNSDVHMPLAGLASGQYLVRVTLDTGRSTTVLTKSLALID
ncbi:MAG: cellulase family glycosylhydrolase, partial [Bacteroidetes bacterium]|nr:cellulase family glycosylhydrolase [Bacteroidota bacterium]